ncbi:tyrosine-protein phosphatase [Ureibacillus acetophenoni]|uniref:Tyrosine-protein phosphatase n=1 Tax=Ureibacillus acetophenoni TaxID=614649 RepID=A0A285U901_9BACL|nr:CpsB/CapC family capsule biosynthesis tyrosine phosphatase [Ureibacillus acetophenoni]SOC38390.1 protein-tyrosine phosphatase [Ureibacillus acetophenoni]
MIDIHSHILFNVDDGPGTIEQSIEMLETAANEGIRNIISTSHLYHPQYSVPAKVVKNQVKQLQNEMDQRGIPLSIHLGHEVRLNEKLVGLYESKEIYTLANSRYLLIELPSNTVPHYTKYIIRDLLSVGTTPIIAHPERNRGIAENPKRLESLIRDGAFAQITASSLAGHFGKKVQKLSLELVTNNLVHTYGSDAHNLSTRPFLFRKGLDYLEKQKELDSIQLFLENNRRVLLNQQLVQYEPRYEKKKWWKLF